jgi:hypothetical protein
MNENLNELFSALSKAQGKMESAIKDSKNPFFKSNYADLASCWETAREPLSSNGLSIIQIPEEIEGKWMLKTILAHSSGQYIESSIPILALKMDSQSFGSAITYARRYALSSCIGISSVDDDGEASMNRNEKNYKHSTPIQGSIQENKEPSQQKGKLVDITIHEGKDKTGKIFKKFGFQIDSGAGISETYGTFSEELMDKGEKLKGKIVNFSYDVNGKYKNLKSIELSESEKLDLPF